jgi:hypothetical protein
MPRLGTRTVCTKVTEDDYAMFAQLPFHRLGRHNAPPCCALPRLCWMPARRWTRNG